MIQRENHSSFVLTGNYNGPPPDAPRISVVIAAKDEAETIEACVRSMLSQDYPNFEVIVCNDRSNDDTGPIVARIAAEDDRLTLVNIEHLPEGWYGKNNAMQTGIAQAAGDWICMIDADCKQHSTRTLSVAMQYAQDENADLLSVLPVLEMKGFWENIIQPVCGAIMMIWFRPDRVNNPRRSTAYANGAFMLIKRSAYQAIGTHEAVRQELNEDMRMAWLLKKAGLMLRVVRCHGLYTVRMYTSFSRILRGWSRIFFGTFGTLGRLSMSILVIVLMSLMPYVAAAIGAIAWGLGNWGGWLAACGLVGGVAVALQLSAIFRFYRLIDAVPALFWTYPLGCSMGLYALILALGKLRPGAKVVWKSTAYAKTDQPSIG
jgi:glycosyltransferase involved in cell wall biosynthesis